MAPAPNSRNTSSRRGSVAIEYAIILPVLLLFLLGIMDVGRLLWTYTTLYWASEAAARCGAIQYKYLTTDCTTASGIESYALQDATGLGLVITASAFTASNQTCGMQVVASYDFGFVIPWLNLVPPFGTSNSITLTATACYPT